MSRILTAAFAMVLASAGAAYAATPQAVTKLVADCCAMVLSCCGAGGCC